MWHVVLQVAGWLGVDVRMLIAFPTARSLAAHLRVRPPPDGPRGSAAFEGTQSLEARLEAQDPRKRPRVSRQEPDQAAKPDQAWVSHPVSQPDPAAAVAVLQRGGRVSFPPVAARRADVRSAGSRASVPSSSHARAAEPGMRWRVKLRDCVDASPVILVQSGAAGKASDGAQSGGQPRCFSPQWVK